MAEEDHQTKPQATHPTEKNMPEEGKVPRSMVYRYAPSSHQARMLCTALLVVLLLVGITALVLYLVYRPTKPRFTVIGAAIYELGNVSSVAPANAISTSMQFTVVIHNPNERASVRYDRLSAYASYRGQPITPPSPLPPLVQEPGGTVSLAPLLGRGVLPVAPEVTAWLATDEAYGVVALRLIILGRLKYKAGSFRSAWDGMDVRCDMLVGFKKGAAGQVPLLGAPECDVDI